MMGVEGETHCVAVLLTDNNLLGLQSQMLNYLFTYPADGEGERT